MWSLPGEDFQHSLQSRTVHLHQGLQQIERRFAEIPDYDQVPGDMRDLEIAATARHALRRFLQGILNKAIRMRGSSKKSTLSF